MNSKLEPQLLPEGAWSLLQNCDITTSSLIRRRAGRVIPAAGNNLLGAFVGQYASGLAPLRTDAGLRQVVLAYYDTGTSKHRLLTWDNTGDWVVRDETGVFSFLTDVDLVQAGGKLWFFNGTSPVRSWNGTTYAVEDTNLNTDPPRGSFGCLHANRLFVSGVPAFPDRVFYSDILSFGPGAWNRTLNWFGFENGTGKPIVGMVSMRKDELWIFTSGSIHILHTVSAADRMYLTTIQEWAQQVIDPRIGCSARRTIVPVGEDIYFLDQHGQLRSVARSIQDNSQGTLQLAVSDPLYMEFDALPKPTLRQASAAYFQGKYLLTVAAGTPRANIQYVFETSRSAWVKYTGWAVERLIVSDVETESILKLYGIGSNGDGQLYRLLEGTKEATKTSFVTGLVPTFDNPSTKNFAQGGGLQFGTALVPKLFTFDGTIIDTPIAWAAKTRAYDMGAPHLNKIYTEGEALTLPSGMFSAVDPINVVAIADTFAPQLIGTIPFFSTAVPTFDDPAFKTFLQGGGLQFGSVAAQALFSFAAAGPVRSKFHLDKMRRNRWIQLLFTSSNQWSDIALQHAYIRALPDNYDMELG